MIDTSIPLSLLKEQTRNTLVEHLKIEFTELGKDYLKGKMPVNSNVHQPMGILHGGATVSLAETLGSMASACAIDLEKQICVGMEVNANHIRQKKDGYIFGTAKAIRLGKKIHIWNIEITDEEEVLVAVSRLTVAILDRRKGSGKPKR